MKTCTKCNKEKELIEFCKHKGSEDGLNWHCKQCAKAHSAKYNAIPENKAKRKAYRSKPEVKAKQKARDRLRHGSEEERAQKENKEAEELELRKSLPKKLKFGHIRWDGMVFWCYQKSCKHGERWFSPEKFERRLSEQTMRDAVRRAWKGGKNSFEIIGLPPEIAVDVDLHKKGIAQKIFPDQKLERDHMRPLAMAKDNEDARRRNHFTNFVYIPALLNRAKSDVEFWDWFRLQSKSVQKCITLQCQYNEKIRAEIS